ncbi:hypothetical protein [uncultured Methanobrevibacter sp.]|uniref:hypothetical protein n=1 Tax=uncultured Methanobrevibacter sp. TaxID=253161 RepID=UPI0025D8A76B|nr:hypothetical protein [uncultured Methanobrevibacter sp.]
MRKNKVMILLIIFSIFIFISSVSASDPPMPYDDVGGTILGILIMLGFGFFCCISGNE